MKDEPPIPRRSSPARAATRGLSWGWLGVAWHSTASVAKTARTVPRAPSRARPGVELSPELRYSRGAKIRRRIRGGPGPHGPDPQAARDLRLRARLHRGARLFAQPRGDRRALRALVGGHGAQ